MATLHKKKGNRLSRFFSVSDFSRSDSKRLAKVDERRAVSHNPQATLPDRTVPPPNAPWLPPQQQHTRSSSAQISKNSLLHPLSPPAEIHRRPVGGSESSQSLRVSSATTSPVTSRPNTGYSSQPSSPYRNNAASHSSNALNVPGASPGGLSPGASPEQKNANKRRSWFGGGGAKLSKPGKGVQEEKPEAWIVGMEGRPAYDLNPLLNAQQVRNEIHMPVDPLLIVLGPRAVESTRQHICLPFPAHFRPRSVLLRRLWHLLIQLCTNATCVW